MSLDLMKARMNAIGGATSDGRINDGKLKSLRSAMKNSYQAEWIELNEKTHRCLINSKKIGIEYDQKEISIEFDSGIKTGDVFFWNRTNSYWLVLNQRYTEEAYFRGEIRKCNYEIATDKNKYHIWLRGPVEASTDWKNKHSIVYNDLNYSLLFYIVKNEDTNEFFTRHRKVKFDNHNWVVAAVDRYTQENIIEVYLAETNDNEMEDAKIISTSTDIDTSKIKGKMEVSPYDTDIVYTINGLSGGVWKTTSQKIEIKEFDETSCTIDVVTGRSGKFILQYEIEGVPAEEIEVKINSL